MAYTTIDDPTIYFNTKLWTGNGSTGNGQTGIGFQPDWIWIKARAGTQGAQSHNLFDSVRGEGKYLFSDSNDAESTDTNRLTSFDSDGFTVGSNNAANASSTTYVAWNWKAGGSASSNSNGNITSSVSANTTAGFSIVSYTGTGSATTVGHGLGSELACYIIKQTNTTGGWIVYHKSNTSSPETDYLRLDKTDATVDDAIFNDTAPTSSVFSIGTNAPVNTSSGTYITYCFAEKKGYSKFGSYTGNGSTDGTFIYTGFKPAWILVKRTNSTFNWLMYDNKRDELNPNTSTILADDSGAEYNIGRDIDFLSNGFKTRANYNGINGSGDSYIYMAFAENPFVTSTGIPTTAR